MNAELLKVRLRQILAAQLGVDEAQIVPTARFTDDLNADSLDLVEMIMALEEEFNIEIPDEEAEKLINVQDALDYLTTKLAQAPAA